MTSTAILTSLTRGLVADTESGVPRSQNIKADATTTGDRDNVPAKAPLPRDNSPSPNATVRRTSIDWETGSVVFRVIDEHSGRTVSQSPEEALLRLRAYARQKETAVSVETPPTPKPRAAKSV